MKIMIDNNVILDLFQNREPFVEFSSKVLRLVETNHVEGYITANSITDNVKVVFIFKREKSITIHGNTELKYIYQVFKISLFDNPVTFLLM